jgi:RNA polymerase sigma-70 factor, ECF subfamily
VTGSWPETATDLDLVKLAQAGDTEAFGELVERNRRAVFRAALAAVRSPAEADDVAQEAFVTAFRKLGSFRGESQFRTWLLSITWRKAIDRRKSVTRLLRLTASEPRSLDGDARRRSDRPRGDGRALAGRRSRGRRAPGERHAAHRHAAEEAARRAAARQHRRTHVRTDQRMLGVPLGTVKWRVAEARRVLKRKLQALGYAYE